MSGESSRIWPININFGILSDMSCDNPHGILLYIFLTFYLFFSVILSRWVDRSIPFIRQLSNNMNSNILALLPSNLALLFK